MPQFICPVCQRLTEFSAHQEPRGCSCGFALRPIDEVDAAGNPAHPPPPREPLNVGPLADRPEPPYHRPDPARIEATCDLYINRSEGNHEGNMVRIEAKLGRHLFARIHVPIEQFAEAMFGKMVPARIKIGRDTP